MRVSQRMKTVLPIYKGKGPKKDPTSYRPISLLSITGKVLEKAIQMQLKRHMFSEGIIPPNQHGFRPNHSTATCLTSIVDSIASKVNRRKLAALIALDFSKAFDTIEHDSLVEQLKHTANMIHKNTATWIHSYLNERYQKVLVGDKFSNTGHILTGVPQGSVLGPLLFTFYTSDIPNIQHTNTFLFADDTTLVIEGDSLEQLESRCELAINKISDYAISKNLYLNHAKTKLILCTTPQKRKFLTRSMQIITNTNTISEETTATILGVTIDNNLCYEKHLHSVSRKANARTYNIRRNTRHLSYTTRKLLIQTLVLPLLDYCNVVFAAAKDTHLHVLNISYKLAVRTVFCKPHRTHTDSLLTTLGWLPLKKRMYAHRLKFYNNVLDSKQPANLHHYTLAFTNHTAPRTTRSSTLGIVPTSKIQNEWGKQQFSYWACKLHNEACLSRNLQTQ